MSTNIHIHATRAIIVGKTGKKRQETIFFNAWQTPTTVTLKIMESGDKVQAYKDWVMSIAKDEEVIKYHIERLDDWLANCKEDGYDIEFEAW